MITKIVCPACGHVGIVDDGLLPRKLTCHNCGAARLVERGELVISAERRCERANAILKAVRSAA